MTISEKLNEIADDLERNFGFVDRPVANLRALAQSASVPEAEVGAILFGRNHRAEAAEARCAELEKALCALTDGEK